MTTNANTITGPQYGATREMPWDVMGQDLKVTNDRDLDAALAETGLDFQVEMLKVAAYDGVADGEPLTLANFVQANKSRAVVRPWQGGRAVVGMVGTRYTPIQNRDAFAVAEPLLGEYGARIDGMADFRHGGASIMALDLGRPITLNRPDGGTDVTAQYLLAKNSLDGSSALTYSLTAVRMACTNVLPVAIKGATQSWKMAHTPNADERMALAHSAILQAVGFQEAFTVKAQAMLDQPMVDAEFAKIVSHLFPVDPEATGKVADRKRETQATLMHLYRTSPTLEGVRGTVWGGYNAVTEYLDHFRPVKGDETLARAEGQIDGPNVRVKAKVWNLFAVA